MPQLYLVKCIRSQCDLLNIIRLIPHLYMKIIVAVEDYDIRRWTKSPTAMILRIAVDFGEYS